MPDDVAVATCLRAIERGINLIDTPRISCQGDDVVILRSPRYDFFPHFNGIYLPMNTANCSHCQQLLTGGDFGFGDGSPPMRI